MEPLYTTQFTYTLDEYFKYGKAVNRNKNNIKKRLLPLAIFFLLFFSYTFRASNDMEISNSSPFSSTLPTVFASLASSILLTVILFAFIHYFRKAKTKKYFYSNEIYKETVKYEFFDNNFISSDSHYISNFNYNELTEIIENETNFYLMIADNQGFIILKDNCSSELISFLRSLKNKTAR